MAPDEVPFDPALVETLRAVNAARLRGERDATAPDTAGLAAAGTRLAVYGTLAPGQPNHGRLAPLGGAWRRGVVCGRLHETGWGATMGYPGMTWAPGGAGERPIDVHVLESPALPAAWPDLDRFEGEEYLRILVPVATGGGGVLVANVYAVRSRMA